MTGVLKLGIRRLRCRTQVLGLRKQRTRLALRQVQLLQCVHALCWWSHYNQLQKQKKSDTMLTEAAGAEESTKLSVKEFEALQDALHTIQRDYLELESGGRAIEHRMQQQQRKYEASIAESRAVYDQVHDQFQVSKRKWQRASAALDTMTDERDSAVLEVAELKKQIVHMAEVSLSPADVAWERRTGVESEAWRQECADLQLRNRQLEQHGAALQTALEQTERREMDTCDINAMLEREKEMLMGKLVVAERSVLAPDKTVEMEVDRLQRDVFTALVALEERDRIVTETQYKFEQSEEALAAMTEMCAQQDWMISTFEEQREGYSPRAMTSGRSLPVYGGRHGRSPPGSRPPSPKSIGRPRSPTCDPSRL